MEMLHVRMPAMKSFFSYFFLSYNLLPEALLIERDKKYQIK